VALMWIEYDDGTADGCGGARWHKVTDEQLDAVLAFAEKLCGKPDTLA